MWSYYVPPASWHIEEDTGWPEIGWRNSHTKTQTSPLISDILSPGPIFYTFPPITCIYRPPLPGTLSMSLHYWTRGRWTFPSGFPILERSGTIPDGCRKDPVLHQTSIQHGVHGIVGYRTTYQFHAHWCKVTYTMFAIISSHLLHRSPTGSNVDGERSF